MSHSLPGTSLTSAISSTESVQDIFSARSSIQCMLDVEAALARALVNEGVIPASALGPWLQCCQADRIDIAALISAARDAGNIAIPMVKQLTAAVAAIDEQASRYVHWGATSQDVIDTGRVLQLRDAINVITHDLALMAATLARLAQQHRDIPMIGRTWLQHALPITFGLKLAGWLDAVMRHQQRLDELTQRVFVLQFGGASGTLASLGHHAAAVSRSIAVDLGLALPSLPWHANRDRFVECATTLGILTGTLGKIARDVSLMSQTEIAELAEPSAPGRGGSSSMPHKRNPVGCAAVLSAATRVPSLVATMLSAMPNEHERALGGWQSEWETLPEIVALCASSLAQLHEVMDGLQINTDRMRSNIDATRGMVMAEAVVTELAHSIGRLQAHQIVEHACHHAYRQNTDLLTALQAEPQVTERLSKQRLAQLLDPHSSVGEAGMYVDRVLAAYQQRNP
ncbi:MAG: 3-carboxy-cis,cis-muconate cycloisomerase [Betaproteobacteria bacterium]